MRGIRLKCLHRDGLRFTRGYRQNQKYFHWSLSSAVQGIRVDDGRYIFYVRKYITSDSYSSQM